MSKKNILFFGELPPKTIHGASISNQMNIEFLRKSFNIVVVEEFSDLKHHSTFAFSKVIRFLKAVFMCWSVSVRKQFDFYYGVIYLSSFGILKNLITISVFKLFNPKAQVILHFHRSDFQDFLQKPLNRFLFNCLDKLIKKYIVLAYKQKTEISFFTKNEISVLYNAIDEESLCKKGATRTDQKIRILFLSNFIRDKGFGETIEAQKRINALYPNTFELVCYGAFANSNDQDKSIVSLSGIDQISISNRIYGSEKSKVLNDADVVVLPSYNEGLPLILLESLFLGKAIVITKVGYIGEVLGDDYPLYCKPKDIDSIVAKLIDFKTKYNDQQFSEFLQSKYSLFTHEQHARALNHIFY